MDSDAHKRDVLSRKKWVRSCIDHALRLNTSRRLNVLLFDAPLANRLLCEEIWDRFHSEGLRLYAPNLDGAVVAQLRALPFGVTTAHACFHAFLRQHAATIASTGGFDVVMADVHRDFHHGAGNLLGLLSRDRLLRDGAHVSFAVSLLNDRLKWGSDADALASIDHQRGCLSFDPESSAQLLLEARHRYRTMVWFVGHIERRRVPITPAQDGFSEHAVLVDAS